VFENIEAYVFALFMSVIERDREILCLF